MVEARRLLLGGVKSFPSSFGGAIAPKNICILGLLYFLLSHSKICFEDIKVGIVPVGLITFCERFGFDKTFVEVVFNLVVQRLVFRSDFLLVRVLSVGYLSVFLVGIESSLLLIY